MKKSIFLIFTLACLAGSAWALSDDEEVDTLQGYSDVVNEAVSDAVNDAYEEENSELEAEDRDSLSRAAEESAANSPYSFNSSRIAQILDENHSDEDEEELQQRYAAMHEEDAAEDDNVAF